MVLDVGLDVHRPRTQVAMVGEEGRELFNRNVANDPKKLADAMRW